jgi:hypothetical protein
MKKRLYKSILCLFLAFVMLISTGGMLLADDSAVRADKICSELRVAMSAAERDELISVYIWIQDIDRNAIDVAVERQTGITRDNVEVISGDMSDSLTHQLEASATDDDSFSDDFVSEFSEYLTRTSAERAVESERADLFIATSRNISMAHYGQHNSRFISDSRISEESIIFNSQFAPLIVAELTPREIEIVARQIRTVSIGLFANDSNGEPPVELLSTPRAPVFPSVIGDLHRLGLNGTNVRVGMIDSGIITPGVSGGDNHGLALTPTNRFTRLGQTSVQGLFDHANWCARIAVGSDGVAPQARVWTRFDAINANWSNKITGTMIDIEELLKANITIISSSRGFENGLTYNANFAAWIDHVVRTQYVTILAATGNAAFETNPPRHVLPIAYSDNVISVSAHSNTVTPVLQDSRWINDNQAAKPDIVAFAPWHGTPNGGGATSSATPYAAGIVALMQQLRPSLRTQPHVVKAILMASSHSKATDVRLSVDEQETMSNGEGGSGLTTRQGAGVMNPAIAIYITAQGNFRTGIIAQGLSSAINFSQQKNNAEGLNVTLSWLRGNIHQSDGTIGSFSREDLGLFLRRNGNTVATSDLPRSSAELAYFDNTNSAFSSWTNSNANFEVRVFKNSHGVELVPFAIAWSASDAKNPIYNMQADPNLTLFAGSWTAGNSTHPLLGSHSAVRTVNMNSNPRAINITQRGGDSQGVDIRLPSLVTRPGHRYRFEFTARFVGVNSSITNHTAMFSAVSGDSGAGTNVAELRHMNVGSNQTFTLQHTTTHEAISAHRNSGIVRYRFGGGGGHDLIITGITITEIPPNGTFYYSGIDSALHLFAGHGSAEPSTHYILGSNSGTRTVNTLNGAISITGRGGTSQGVDIQLANLLPMLDPTQLYRISFSGSVTSGNGLHDVWINAVSSAGNNVGSSLDTQRRATNVPFNLSYETTYHEMLSLLNSGVNRLRLGGAAREDLLITGIGVSEVWD